MATIDVGPTPNAVRRRLPAPEPCQVIELADPRVERLTHRRAVSHWGLINLLGFRFAQAHVLKRQPPKEAPGSRSELVYSNHN